MLREMWAVTHRWGEGKGANAPGAGLGKGGSNSCPPPATESGHKVDSGSAFHAVCCFREQPHLRGATGPSELHEAMGEALVGKAPLEACSPAPRNSSSVMPNRSPLPQLAFSGPAALAGGSSLRVKGIRHYTGLLLALLG